MGNEHPVLNLLGLLVMLQNKKRIKTHMKGCVIFHPVNF